MGSDSPVSEQIARWIALYERGIYTHYEMINSISSLAILPGFFESLIWLPHEVVEALRERVSRGMAAHPEDLTNGNAYYKRMTEDEFRAAQLRERQIAYWNLRLLAFHFYPDRPIPPFEPLKRIGIVSDSIVVEGLVVLFGVDEWYLVREHPIHCVAPSGLRIVTSACQQSFVRSAADEVGDYIQQKYGRMGVFLAANVKLPAEVPPGTEVWVDRSAAGPIPPLSDLLPTRCDGPLPNP